MNGGGHAWRKVIGAEAAVPVVAIPSTGIRRCQLAYQFLKHRGVNADRYTEQGQAVITVCLAFQG